jgi:hypothetical protein
MLGHSIVSQHIIEPEDSIPNSQELSDFGEVGWGDMDWIGLAQDRNSVLNLQVL